MGNSHRPQGQGKCNRKQTGARGRVRFVGLGLAVRVKRCGKSAPVDRVTGCSANPTRSKTTQGEARATVASLSGSQILPGRSLEAAGTAVLEKWPLSTEPGLPARFGLFLFALNCYQAAFSRGARNPGCRLRHRNLPTIRLTRPQASLRAFGVDCSADALRRTAAARSSRLVGRQTRPLCRLHFSAAALIACGCQTSSQATKHDTPAAVDFAAKGDDTAVLTSATTGQNGSVVTTANGSSNGGTQTAQTAAKDVGGSRPGSFFGHNDIGDGLVLPRNDEAAENGAADKTAANEF